LNGALDSAIEDGLFRMTHGQYAELKIFEEKESFGRIRAVILILTSYLFSPTNIRKSRICRAAMLTLTCVQRRRDLLVPASPSAQTLQVNCDPCKVIFSTTNKDFLTSPTEVEVDLREF
jgi:hypothetical protein